MKLRSAQSTVLCRSILLRPQPSLLARTFMLFGATAPRPTNTPAGPCGSVHSTLGPTKPMSHSQ